MRALASSPSTGEYEALRAMRLARAIGGRDLTPAVIKRHLPKRTTVTEVTNVLAGLSGTYVHSSGGKYSLTTAGIARSRAHHPRGYTINPT